MDKRVRSPNYPALSLPEAIEKVTVLYKNQHTYGAPREVAVKSMGYNSLNGASATAISALHKYGLLDRVGDEVKVSERALRIMHPNSAEERTTAIAEAAREPELFSELNERFPGQMPNDEVLKNYLIRKGFAPSALPSVLLAYRKTIEFAGGLGGAYDSGSMHTQETTPMQHPSPSLPVTAAMIRAAPPLPQPDENERRVGVIDLPDGGHVRIMATMGVDAAEALDWAEEIIALQRRVLAKRRAPGTDVKPSPNVSANESDDNA